MNQEEIKKEIDRADKALKSAEALIEKVSMKTLYQDAIMVHYMQQERYCLLKI